MKKSTGWILSLATVLISGALYYFITLSLYVQSKDLYNFPVPKNAQLVEENKQGKSYDWSKASEENGIPFGYELVLKTNGWKKGEREGASVYYSKGNHKIDLISTTENLGIIKVN